MNGHKLRLSFLKTARGLFAWSPSTYAKIMAAIDAENEIDRWETLAADLAPSETAMFRDYLLDRIKDDAKLMIETKYFDEADFFEKIQVAQFILIQDYLRGNLSKSDRKLFEEIFPQTDPYLVEVKSLEDTRPWLNRCARIINHFRPHP